MLRRCSIIFLFVFIITNNINAKQVECPVEIKREIRKYKNHKQLLYIIKRESTFKIKAKNGHCIGLSQVNHKIWTKELIGKKIIRRKRDLYTIKGSIRACVYILKQYNYNYNKYRGLRASKQPKNKNI